MASCDKIIARVKFIVWRGRGNTTELVTQHPSRVGATGLQPPTLKLKFKKHGFLDMMILNFYAIYPSAELSHQNRLMNGTLGL